MSAMRTGFDAEHDILQGLTLEQAKAEAARLEAKANELTGFLAQYRAGLTTVVRQNLEAERDRYEWESSGISARIAEYLGQVQRVRQIDPPPTARALLVQRRNRAMA